MYRFSVPLYFAIAVSCGGPATQAACEQWDLSGVWEIRQSNVNSFVVFEIQQKGSVLSGQAQFQDDVEGYDNAFGRRGFVTGNARGNKLDMTVNWEPYPGEEGPRRKGIYKGKISPQGRLTGTTFDARNLRSSASFRKGSPFNCQDFAVEEPTGPPPIKLGKVKIPNVDLSTPMEVCVFARSARKRGSPAAPGLERQCREAGGTP